MTGRHPAGTTGTVVALLVLVLVVGTANLLRSAVVPDRYHFMFNLCLAAVAVGIGVATGMTVIELGLAVEDVRAGCAMARSPPVW